MPTPNIVRTFALVAALALCLAAQSQAQSASPPATPPEDWGPVSINLEDVPYPHPVSFLERELYDQVVRIAYMDVAPVGPANGQTVVLLHGGSYYGWYWEQTIDALTNEGFRVVVKDRLGWGRSSKPILQYSMNLHASNTKALMNHLGIAEAAIVGHSMGGQFGTRFAFLYPESTTHLVMVNPIGLSESGRRVWREPTWGGGEMDRQAVYEAQLRTATRRVVEWKPEFLEHVRIRFGQVLSGEWPRMTYVRSIRGNAGGSDTVVHDWPRMATKTMIIGGDIDQGPGFPERARAAVETLQNAKLVLFPNVGHNPHLEIPETFNAELIRFLQSDPDEPAGEGR
jgi:pimeloyl-ACP methyl ester carboxylesterase